MKTILRISLFMIISTVVILVITDMDFVSKTKVEMQNISETSMRNVLKGKSINEMYSMSKNDMEIELIRNIGINTNVNSDLTVDIYSIDEIGLIDMSLTSSFSHTNGYKDSRTLRKAMMVEQYLNNEK